MKNFEIYDRIAKGIARKYARYMKEYVEFDDLYMAGWEVALKAMKEKGHYEPDYIATCVYDKMIDILRRINRNKVRTVPESFDELLDLAEYEPYECCDENQNDGRILSERHDKHHGMGFMLNR